MAETENVARRWCPSCEPERDPTREILQVLWCPTHYPRTSGSEDAKVRFGPGLSSTDSEADGEDCAKFARALREAAQRHGAATRQRERGGK